MNSPKPYFGNIVIQNKGDDNSKDFRSFCYCSLGDEQWELRGYGDTIEKAASEAWQAYLDFGNWDHYGYIISG